MDRSVILRRQPGSRPATQRLGDGVRTGLGRPARTITDGIDQLAALALDPAGDDFVVNYRAYEVYEYAAGTTRIEHTITSGIVSPRKLAVDSSGYLYAPTVNSGLSAKHETLTIYTRKRKALSHHSHHR